MFLLFYLYTNVCISLLLVFVPFAIRLEEKEQTGNKESNRKDMERVKHFLAIVMQWGSVSSYRTHRGNKSFIFRQETVVRNRWGIASLQVAQNRPLQFLRIGCQCNKKSPCALQAYIGHVGDALTPRAGTEKYMMRSTLSHRASNK